MKLSGATINGMLGLGKFVHATGSVAKNRLLLKLFSALFVGVAVALLSNLFFEVTMIWVGAMAFAHAYLIVDSAVFAVFGVIIIALGCFCSVVSRGCAIRIALFGVLVLFFGLSMPHFLGDFPYGKDDAGHIIQLGMTLINNEVIDEDLSNETGGKTSRFLSAPVSPTGHRYVALNRLGCSTLAPSALVAKMEEDLNPIFPILVHGAKGNGVVAGNVIGLGILPEPIGNNPVKSYQINSHAFKLIALPGHWLEGTAVHGIVRDSTGSLWLFQYGLVEDAHVHEPNTNQLANYPIADRMWSRMAGNITNQFRADFSDNCNAISGDRSTLNSPTTPWKHQMRPGPPVPVRRIVGKPVPRRDRGEVRSRPHPIALVPGKRVSKGQGHPADGGHAHPGLPDRNLPSHEHTTPLMSHAAR